MPSAMALSPTPAPKGQGKLVATVGASAAALLIATVAAWEGKRNDPYLDIIKVPTVCFGETRVAMRHYTDAECKDMLADALAGFGKGVLERNPELRTRPAALAAATSLSYNIGLSTYRRSSVAKRFSAGQWKAACDGFLAWSYAGGRQVSGLLNRRRAEREICLRDVP